ESLAGEPPERLRRLTAGAEEAARALGLGIEARQRFGDMLVRDAVGLECEPDGGVAVAAVGEATRPGRRHASVVDVPGLLERREGALPRDSPRSPAREPLLESASRLVSMA